MSIVVDTVGVGVQVRKNDGETLIDRFADEDKLRCELFVTVGLC